MLPSILTVAGAGRAVLARYQYDEELMYFVAGLVSEVKVAGYLRAPEDYVEEDTALSGRPEPNVNARSG
jgi:hypothetical protein